MTIALPCTHFRPGLDHLPLGAVDHDRHAGDVGLGGDQVEEGGHGLDAVEQALVHVDVEDLRPGLDLVARDRQRGGVVAVADQLAEARRAGDVGPLADVDEQGSALTPSSNGFAGPDERCSAPVWPGRESAARRLTPATRLGDVADVLGRGAAAAAEDVDQAAPRPLLQMAGGLVRAPRRTRRRRWAGRRWDRRRPGCRRCGPVRRRAGASGRRPARS